MAKDEEERGNVVQMHPQADRAFAESDGPTMGEIM